MKRLTTILLLTWLSAFLMGSNGTLRGQGDPAVPGLSRGTGTEQTLELLVRQKEPAIFDRSQVMTIYIDPTGNDTTGDGLTPATALRSLDAAGDLVNLRGDCGAEIVMTGGSTWSATADFGACTGAGDDCGFGDFTPDCSGAEDLAIWIHSSDPDNRAIIDCSVDPGIEGNGVVSSNPATESGWVVVTGVEIDCDGVDAYHAANEGRIFVANGGQDNDITTAKTSLFYVQNTGEIVAVGTGGNTTESDDIQGPAEAVDNGKLALYDSELSIPSAVSGTPAALSCFQNTEGPGDELHCSWLGGRASVTSSPGWGWSTDMASGSPGAVYRLSIARVSAHVTGASTSGCGFSSGTNQDMLWDISQVSCTGARMFYADAISFSTMKMHLLFRDVVTDAAGLTLYRWRNMSNDSIYDFDVQFINTFSDEDDTGNSFSAHGGLQSTIADFFTACGADCTVTEMTDLTSDPFVDVSNENLACADGTQCEDTASGTYSFTPATIVPSFWLGEVIEDWSLLRGNAGAH